MGRAFRLFFRNPYGAARRLRKASFCVALFLPVSAWAEPVNLAALVIYYPSETIWGALAAMTYSIILIGYFEAGSLAMMERQNTPATLKQGASIFEKGLTKKYMARIIIILAACYVMTIATIYLTPVLAIIPITIESAFILGMFAIIALTILMRAKLD